MHSLSLRSATWNVPASFKPVQGLRLRLRLRGLGVMNTTKAVVQVFDFAVDSRAFDITASHAYEVGEWSDCSAKCGPGVSESRAVVVGMLCVG